MADYAITAVDRRVVYTGSAGLGPYSFSFPILAQTDLAVYFNTTLLTITSDYTVSITASTGQGTVTIVTGSSVSSTPDGDDTITIVGARDIERTTDFVTAGDLLASSLNTELDSQTIFAQQVSEDAARAIKAPVTDPTSINMELPAAATRQGKFLHFNSSTGNPEVASAVSTISGASDASINSEANGNLLTYSSSTSKWINGHALTGDYTVTGSFTTDSVQINGTDIGHTDDTDLLSLSSGAVTVNGNQTLQSTDGGSGAGPDLSLHRNSASPAAADFLGRLQFKGENDAGGAVTFASVDAQLDDQSNGAEDGTLLLKTVVNNTLTTQMDISSAGVVFTPPLSLNTDLAVEHGGTGASSLTNGGLLLGRGTSPVGAMAVLADGEMIVGDGTTDPVAESGATLRSSIGVGTGDSPQFTGIELGHASDTTLARSGAGDITVEGNQIYRAGGTDVPVTDGGTGVSTLTNGGLLLGRGTSPVGAMAVLADGEMVVGDGTTDPVAESGATLRTSIGVGTGDSVDFTSLSLLGMKIQSFEVAIQHNSGVVKHRIGQAGNSGSAGNWHDKISNASSTLTATPSVDGSTDFTNGMGVSANVAIFDVAAQTAGRALLVCAPANCDTNGTAINLRPGFASRDVDGETRIRLEVQVKDYSGNAFNLNTTNLASGADRVGMQFIGFLA